MLGAIIGDIVGSPYEFANTSNPRFPLFSKRSSFTDDTICTAAVADALVRGSDFGQTLREWCLRYPNPMGAYGGSFNAWLHSENPQPYNSFGNGAAMRVSPVGWAFNSEAETLRAALASAAPTHNHVEGLIGASVVARAIFQLRAMNRPSFLSGEVSALVAASYGEDWEYYLPARGVFDETCQDVSLSRSTFALFPRASSQPFAGQSCGVAIRTLSQRSSAHLPRLVGASLPKSGRRLCRCSLLIWLTLL